MRVATLQLTRFQCGANSSCQTHRGLTGRTSLLPNLPELPRREERPPHKHQSPVLLGWKSLRSVCNPFAVLPLVSPYFCCHPWPCMLLNVCFHADSSPTLGAIFCNVIRFFPNLNEIFG